MSGNDLNFSKEEVGEMLKNPDVKIVTANDLVEIDWAAAVRRLQHEAKPAPALKQPAPALKESEAAFESWLVDLAHLRGWKVAGFRPARTNKGWRTPVKYDGEGWPDLVLAREGRLIIVELKSQTGKVTEAQWEWFRLLTRPWNRLDGAYQVYIWRPSDRPEIERILA